MDQIEIREIDSSEASSVNQLVSGAFSYPAGHYFFEDFPIWKSEEVTRLGIFHHSTLLSHVGIRFTHIKTKQGSDPVALIGGVATQETARGQGLSTRLLQEAIRRIDEKNCSWSFLWGSEHDFYGKLGYHLAGVQCRALIADLSITPSPLRAKEIKLGLNESIFQDFIRRPLGIQFSERDRSWFFRHRSVQWLYLENPFAYLAYGRGIDLNHMVHEMGGDREGIQKLLFQVYQNDPDAQIMGTEEQLVALGFNSASLVNESLCLARPKSSSQVWNPDYWISGLSAC